MSKPPKPAPLATPTEADTAQVKRSTQLEEAKRRKRQRTVYAGGGETGASNVLG